MKARHKGKLITFEGIDGCGKSTQLALALRYLRRHRLAVVSLREPGSTRVAEQIRRILLDKRNDLEPLTELLLYEAARSELVRKEIEGHLKAGTIVLCDRFYDSTTAYQGYGRRLDLSLVRRLHKVAVGDIVPDLTFVFDVDLRTAFSRRGRRLDRLESESRAFFRRVRKGFRELAAREPRRVKMIDASGSPDTVFDRLKPHLDRKLRLT